MRAISSSSFEEALEPGYRGPLRHWGNPGRSGPANRSSPAPPGRYPSSWPLTA